MEKENKIEWYMQAFDKWYPLVYQHRNKQEAKSQVRFVIEELNLQPQNIVLDLCCGYGRHIQFLMERIPLTIGIDISAYLLHQSQETAGKKMKLVRGDVRFLPLRDNSFDAVLSFFTSFGYFEKDEDNLQQIKNVYNVLKNNGTFFFDYLNPNQAMKIKRNRTKKTIQRYTIIETRWYEEEKKQLKKKIDIFSEQNEPITTYMENLCIYSLEDLEKMLQHCNFSILKLYGDYDKEQYTNNSQRLIIISKKNE